MGCASQVVTQALQSPFHLLRKFFQLCKGIECDLNGAAALYDGTVQTEGKHTGKLIMSLNLINMVNLININQLFFIVEIEVKEKNPPIA